MRSGALSLLLAALLSLGGAAASQVPGGCCAGGVACMRTCAKTSAHCRCGACTAPATRWLNADARWPLAAAASRSARSGFAALPAGRGTEPAIAPPPPGSPPALPLRI